MTGALRSVSAVGWLFLAWTIGGVLAFAAAGAIRLVLSDTARWMLLGLSIPVGVFIVYWSLRAGRLQGQSPAPRQRILFVSTGVPTYALFTAAILYAALYAIHTVVAKPVEVRASISTSVREHIPWRSCSHWVYIKKAMYAFNKYCVPDPMGAQLRPGTSVVIDGSQSPIGFRAERIFPLQVENRFEGPAIRGRAAHDATRREP